MNYRFCAWLCIPLVALSGCNIIGAAAQVIPPPNTAAAYSIKGQTIGVMVWVDGGIALDYPGLRSDVAKTVQLHFNVAAKGKSKDLEGAQFLDPARIIQWQDNHPELSGLPISQIAAKLGVSRIIYVEVSGFETSSNLYLLKGNASGTIQVAEVTDGKARIGFTTDVHSVYPTTNSEGIPKDDKPGTLHDIYEGTVAEFGGDIAELFYSHAEGK